MEERDGLVVELIKAAVFSGAYGQLSREYPDAPGLEKLRIRWSARVAALAGELAGRTTAAVRPRAA